MKILGICGSLRARSSNLALLRAAVGLAPAGMAIEIYEGLATLPHFNPDLDVDPQPEPVRDLRARIGAADGVIISSPEYMYGIPGSLKNAFDWLVSAGELVDKPVLLLNAATSGGERAQAALIQTFRAMHWNVLEQASLLTPFVHQKLAADGSLTDPRVAEALRGSLAELAIQIGSRSVDR